MLLVSAHGRDETVHHEYLQYQNIDGQTKYQHKLSNWKERKQREFSFEERDALHIRLSDQNFQTVQLRGIGMLV